jgi:hypothetical protein
MTPWTVQKDREAQECFATNFQSILEKQSETLLLRFDG